ncbi:MAG: hypothetical protein GX649_16590, partial [Chloroflexi bacterium]|nr:hypothetical protein [Chloroflexota bacterium]
PHAEGVEPLTLVATLPVGTLREVREVLGLGRFMVRAWRAIERLLWMVAAAYPLLLVVQGDRRFRGFRQTCRTLLGRMSVIGRRLTPGKIAEALSLDYLLHPQGWTRAVG